MQAMGFGIILRQWIQTLHRGARASFLLEKLSPELQVVFSIRQGDPLALILFVIHLEPYLVRLEKVLQGLRMGQVREASLGYVDDVNGLGRDLNDLATMDTITRDFERASGAILNRSRKSTIMGLGIWAGRHNWPLPWLRSVEEAKVYGVTFTPNFQTTVAKSWEEVASSVERTLGMWATRKLDTLQKHSRAIETFALSQTRYMAQILPMPQRVADRLERAAGSFLWLGRFEKLAWEQLQSRLTRGGLRVSNVAARS
jgi:hypothetical protein